MPVSSDELPGSAALSSFCNQDDANRIYSKELADIVEVVAAFGKFWHDWSQLRVLLAFRLVQVLDKYYQAHTSVVGPPKPLITGESFPELRNRLTQSLDAFTEGPPFTLQRLCEILLDPEAFYPTLDKVALAFEKLLLVTSTVHICQDSYPSSLPPLKLLNSKSPRVKVILEDGYVEKPKDTPFNQVSTQFEPEEEIPWAKRTGPKTIGNGGSREGDESLENRIIAKSDDDEQMADAEASNFSSKMEVEDGNSEVSSGMAHNAGPVDSTVELTKGPETVMEEDSLDVLMGEERPQEHTGADPAVEGQVASEGVD